MHQSELKSIRLEELWKCEEEDAEYQLLKQYIMNGFPVHCHLLSYNCKHYWQTRYHPSVEDKLVVNGCLLLCNNTKDATGSIAAAS